MRRPGDRAHRHEYQPNRAERERAEVGPQVVEVREDRRAVEKRRQEDDQNDLGVELHLGQAGNEPEQGAAHDEHDRVRHRQAPRERAQAHHGHEQPGDQELGLAHAFSLPTQSGWMRSDLSPWRVSVVSRR